MARKRPYKLKSSRAGGASAVGILVLCIVAAVVLNRMGIWDFPLRSGTGETPSSAAGTLPAADASLEVWFLDVGQGDSQLIRIPNGDRYYTMLIDTGENKYADGLIAYLTGLGVTKIDALVNSHPHTDHMGGMAEVVEHFEIGGVYMPRLPDGQTPASKAYERLLDAVLDKGLQVTALYEGTYIDAPTGTKFEVYSPRKDAQYNGANNYSAIMKMQYGSVSFLFTGDAEKEPENDVLEQGYDIKADVLKCGHHGSTTSTTWDFLSAVSPRYATISCEPDNQYGHPHAEVLASLEELGCEVYRTDRDGTIRAASDGNTIVFETNLEPVAEKE